MVQTWPLGLVKGNEGELPKVWGIRPLEEIDIYKKFLLYSPLVCEDLKNTNFILIFICFTFPRLTSFQGLNMANLIGYSVK